MTAAFNTSSQLEAEYDDGGLKWHVVRRFFLPAMMVLGIMGNGCVCYVYQFRWRSNTVTLVKRMLAVLDLGSLTCGYSAALYLGDRPESSTFTGVCYFMAFVLEMCGLASALMLLVIATDRYLRFCLRLKGGIDSNLSKKLFAAIVASAVLINVPLPWIFGRRTIDLNHYNIRLVYCFIADEKNYTIFIVWVSVLGLAFISTCSVLVLLYFHIVRSLIKLSRKHDELKGRSSRDPGRLDKRTQSLVMRNTAKVFVAVIFVFFGSHFPHFVTLLISQSSPRLEASMGPVRKTFYDLALVSPMLNNVANPILYSFDSRHFRQEVKTMLNCKTFQRIGRHAFSFSVKSFDLTKSSHYITDKTMTPASVCTQEIGPVESIGTSIW